MLSLRGRAGRFRLADPYRSLPLGVNQGDPYIVTAGAGSERIVTAGWAASRAGQLLAGDFLEIACRLYMALEDVNSDASGSAAISIWPPLREDAQQYMPVITKNARGIFSLAANSAEFPRTVDGLNGATIPAVESIEGPPKASTSLVAFLGDSITAQAAGIFDGTPSNGIGSYYLNGIGYASQLRVLFDCGFDLQPNGTALTFATPGFTTAQVRATHLPQLLAAKPSVVIDESGVNDAAQSIPLGTTRANWLATWTDIIATGALLIIKEIGPMALSFSGNSAGVISARIAALRAMQRELARSLGLPFARSCPDIEATPGSAIGKEAFFFDGLHPNNAGAHKEALSLLPVVKLYVTPTIDSLANKKTITPKADFSFLQIDSFGGRPGPYAASMPAGGTMSYALITEGDQKFWDITFNTETMTDQTDRMVIYNEFDNQDASGAAISPASRTLDAVCAFKLLDGYIDGYHLSASNYGGSGKAELWNHPRDPNNAIFATGQKTVLRTTKFATSAGTIKVQIALSLTGKGKLRIAANEFVVRYY